MVKKVFVIILIISFIVIFPSCKTTAIKKVAEIISVTESTVIVLTTTSETIPETTAIETTAITEVIDTNPVEDEGVTVPYIEGLMYGKDTNTYYALVDNPYGLEADTKAGAFIKDSFEFNGVMENSISLRPEVIYFLQNKILNESKELKFPIPFDLEKNKGITMEVLDNESANKNKSWDNYRAEDFTLLVINTPKDTIFYSPLKTKIEDSLTGLNVFEEKDISVNNFQLTIPKDLKERIFYKQSERIDWAYLYLTVRKSNILITPINNTSYGFQSETEIGMPLFKIIDNLDKSSQTDTNLDQLFRGKYLINFWYTFEQVTYNEDTKANEYKFVLDTGKNIFLNLNNTKISILPAYE